MERLEYRMYGLVPYNLSPIQQGIQFGHAVVEYGMDYFNDSEYQRWATNDKTFIILNGGTTNKDNNSKFYGSLNMCADELLEMGVKFAIFLEPDLGDQLTAIVFLVDERVYDEKKYPTQEDQFAINRANSNPMLHMIMGDKYEYYTNLFGVKEVEEYEHILKLRTFLKTKRLA